VLDGWFDNNSCIMHYIFLVYIIMLASGLILLTNHDKNVNDVLLLCMRYVFMMLCYLKSLWYLHTMLCDFV
jgi:hypothetical protein